jgi:hypothetical protein
MNEADPPTRRRRSPRPAAVPSPAQEPPPTPPAADAAIDAQRDADLMASFSQALAEMEDVAMTAGHLYRVGKDWYADTALLQRAARRHVVEPMQGAYQILAPAGLVRCAPAHGLALPGQSGDLFRCQGQRAAQDIAPIVRDLAMSLGHGAIGGEWESWPASAAATGTRADAPPARPAARAHRTRTPSPCRPSPSGSSPARRSAPSPRARRATRSRSTRRSSARWSGRAAATTSASGRSCSSATWAVTSDRPGDIPAAAHEHRLGRRPRSPAAPDAAGDPRTRRPSARPHRPRGSGPPESAADHDARVSRLGAGRPVGGGRGHVPRLPLPPRHQPAVQGMPSQLPRAQAGARGRSGPAARRHPRRARGPPRLPRATLRTLGAAIATSHEQNPHAPLTDAFFVRLERDVLTAAAPLALGDAAILALVEVAELTPLREGVAVGGGGRPHEEPRPTSST